MKTSAGIDWSCSCSVMCGSGVSRRLDETADSETVYVNLQYSITSSQSSSALYGNLIDPTRIAVYDASLGLSSGNSKMVSYSFQEGGTTVPVERGGIVVTLIQLQLSSGSRRLLEIAFLAGDTNLDAAVSESLLELIGPDLPAGSTVSTSILGSAPDIVANTTVTVKSHVAVAQRVVSDFLTDDSDGSPDSGQLTARVSEKSNRDVSYTPGYIPVVYSSPDAVGVVVSLLPYILAGVAALCLLIGFLVYRYRFLIRSWWDEMVYRAPWTSGGRSWFVGPSAHLTRGKSELSSTPDTDTNVDMDEFDAEIMRTL
jgi:hypothetical protein